MAIFLHIKVKHSHDHFTTSISTIVNSPIKCIHRISNFQLSTHLIIHQYKRIPVSGIQPSRLYYKRSFSVNCRHLTQRLYTPPLHHQPSIKQFATPPTASNTDAPPNLKKKISLSTMVPRIHRHRRSTTIHTRMYIYREINCTSTPTQQLSRALFPPSRAAVFSLSLSPARRPRGSGSRSVSANHRVAARASKTERERETLAVCI